MLSLVVFMGENMVVQLLILRENKKVVAKLLALVFFNDQFLGLQSGERLWVFNVRVAFLDHIVDHHLLGFPKEGHLKSNDVVLEWDEGIWHLIRDVDSSILSCLNIPNEPDGVALNDSTILLNFTIPDNEEGMNPVATFAPCHRKNTGLLL